MLGPHEESAGSVVAILSGNSDGDVRVVRIRTADGSRALHDGDKTSEFYAVVAREVVVRSETGGGV
jgi:hypothetical protein